MTSLVFDKFKIDLTPIKVFVSIIAIYSACMTSIASAATRVHSLEPTVGSLLTSELKSCPVPYSTDYCRTEGVGKCDPKSVWSQVLGRYSWQNTSVQPMCSYLTTSRDQNSES